MLKEDFNEKKTIKKIESFVCETKVTTDKFYKVRKSNFSA